MKMNRRFHFYMGANTKDALEKRCSQSGRNASEEIRHVINTAQINEFPKADFSIAVEKSKPICDRMNRLAAQVNSTGNISKEELDNAIAEVHELVEFIERTYLCKNEEVPNG